MGTLKVNGDLIADGNMSCSNSIGLSGNLIFTGPYGGTYGISALFSDETGFIIEAPRDSENGAKMLPIYMSSRGGDLNDVYARNFYGELRVDEKSTANFWIQNEAGTAYLACSNGDLYLSQYTSKRSGKTIYLETYDTGIFHRKNTTNYEILTAANYSNWCAPVSGSNYYMKVYNSSYVGDDYTTTLNDLANQGFAAAMIKNEEDNPVGAARWVHAINLGWGNTNSTWTSQIALGVELGDGMWYRTNQSNCVGKPWRRLLDTNNYSSYTLPLSGGTLTGPLEISNGQDLYLRALSGGNDSGDIVFTNGSGSEIGRIWLGSAYMLVRFGDNDTTKYLIHSENIGAQSVNYANSTGWANACDTANYAKNADVSNAPGGSIPWAGTIDSSFDVRQKRSMMATYYDGSKWWNLISVRHRNGASDGVEYGLYIKSELTYNDQSLVWNRQFGTDSWQGERTILDTGNFTNWAISRNGDTCVGLTFTSTSPLTFYGYGTGTYTMGMVYVDGNGISMETPRLQNSDSGTPTPFTVATRGGQWTALRCSKTIVQNYGNSSRLNSAGELGELYYVI